MTPTHSRAALKAAEAVARKLDDLFTCGLAVNEACLDESSYQIALVLNRETGLQELIEAARKALPLISTTTAGGVEAAVELRQALTRHEEGK